MSTKKSFRLSLSNGSEDPGSLFDAERSEPSFPSERTETPPFDTQPFGNRVDLLAANASESSDVLGIDARGRVPVIHNAFWIPGKVPSLNDLLDAKSKNQPVLRSIIMRQKPQKGNQRGARYSVYNDIKQDWKRRTIEAIGAPFVRVQACYFGYVIVEETLKRDPSNICSAAIKFIEDGLVEAGVIPNDGWHHVLGIRITWVHRKGRDPGVYVLMTDTMMPETQLVFEYEDHLLAL